MQERKVPPRQSLKCSVSKVLLHLHFATSPFFRSDVHNAGY
jgi:hypothetical protein